MAPPRRGTPPSDEATDEVPRSPLRPEGPTDAVPRRPGDGIVDADPTPGALDTDTPSPDELGALDGPHDGSLGSAEPPGGALTNPATRGVGPETALAEDPLHTAAEEGFELDIPTGSGFLDDRLADVGTPMFDRGTDPGELGLDDIAAPVGLVSDDTSRGNSPAGDVTSGGAAASDDDGVGVKPGAEAFAKSVEEIHPGTYKFLEKLVDYMVAPPGSEKERQLAAAEHDGDGAPVPTTDGGSDGAPPGGTDSDAPADGHIDFGLAQQSAPAYEEKGFLDWLTGGSPASEAERHWTGLADAVDPPPGGNGTNELVDPDSPQVDPDVAARVWGLSADLLLGEAVADAATRAGDVTPNEHADVWTDGAARTYDPYDDFDTTDNPLPPDPDDMPTLAEIVAPELGEGV
jgi:hypothetical protein